MMYELAFGLALFIRPWQGLNGTCWTNSSTAQSPQVTCFFLDYTQKEAYSELYSQQQIHILLMPLWNAVSVIAKTFFALSCTENLVSWGKCKFIPRFIICTVLLLLQSYVCVYPPSPLPLERLEIYFHSLILQRPPLSLEENEKLRLAMKEERRRNKNAQRNELQGT